MIANPHTRAHLQFAHANAMLKHYLSYLIDDISDRIVNYNGIEYNLTKQKSKKHYRKSIKKDIVNIDNEKQIITFLKTIFLKKVDDISLPYHLKTMSKTQLIELSKSKYIRIEYHGWTHAFLSSMWIMY